MKNTISFLSLLSFLIVSHIYGQENLKKGSNMNYGNQKYENETIDSILVNGIATLEGTKVLGLVQVNGNLTAEKSFINSLQVNGGVKLNNCLIINRASINGSLTADNTRFEKELSIASQKITLKMCTLESLTVREMIGFTGIQIVDLRGGTQVTGPIIFESGQGEVWISTSSKISTDQVTGAQVYKK